MKRAMARIFSSSVLELAVSSRALPAMASSSVTCGSLNSVYQRETSVHESNVLADEAAAEDGEKVTATRGARFTTDGLMGSG
jgi:hypothetical protein